MARIKGVPNGYEIEANPKIFWRKTYVEANSYREAIKKAGITVKEKTKIRLPAGRPSKLSPKSVDFDINRG